MVIVQPNRQTAVQETLSRSKLELFLECPRCFYLDKKLNVKRPDSYPYSLNLAVDALLKKEFDAYRNTGEAHPLMKQWGIDAVPFFHPSLNDWREPMRGVRAEDDASGFTLFGAVDDIWKNGDGTLSIVDYKCSGRGPVFSGEELIRSGYRRQMEVYQWLLRRMGFPVSDTAFFVFAFPDRTPDAFNGTLRFTMSISAYSGSDAWVPESLLEARRCLERKSPPQPTDKCSWCAFSMNTVRHYETFPL